MTKRTLKQKQLTHGDIRTYAYKWEFLRRSKEYQIDYKAYTEADNKDKYARLILGKYGLYGPIDPRIPYKFKVTSQQKTIKTIEKGKEPFLGSQFYEYATNNRIINSMIVSSQGAYCLNLDVHIVEFDVNGAIEHEPLSEEEIIKQDTIQIIVNLNTSLSIIKKDIDNILNKWIDLRKTVIPVKETRRREEIYKKYLEIWDLKYNSKKNLTDQEIARRIYKLKDITEVTDSLKQQIKKQRKRCQEIIDGDWKKIG
ncbi:MAG: hypothetical protein A2252_06250 [Elusimicrobia bacterium RIFOXYA2_FULL_39_19]|nr:MAG: hypothetical protein A2252_06250 [Elusimicrobia bacterium RIFOXYA2_FULL_39_19]